MNLINFGMKKVYYFMQKKINLFRKIFLIILITFSFFLRPSENSQAQTTSENNIFLPLVMNNYFKGFSTSEKLVGIYMQQYWTNTSVPDQNVGMAKADTLAGKKHSVSGWFIDIQDNHFINPPSDIKTNNLYIQLESLWKNGYVSFVNINSNATAYAIATGQYDSHLRNMASVYTTWVNQGGGRKAFLAPLPEMNGVAEDGKAWASYGGDPTNYKLAYQRIQNIFSPNGSNDNNIWWVFAPNGWSKSGHEFENYYPGDNLVDIVGFSSYNYGFCWVAIPYQRWENYKPLYEQYVSRIAMMAPQKPIIIAQTGTTAEFSKTNVIDISAKNTWLKINYEYVSKQPQVLGILYYDFDQSNWECNWKITSGGNFYGYKEGASYPAFRYLRSTDLQSIIP